jgi:hypothetical protein
MPHTSKPHTPAHRCAVRRGDSTAKARPRRPWLTRNGVSLGHFGGATTTERGLTTPHWFGNALLPRRCRRRTTSNSGRLRKWSPHELAVWWASLTDWLGVLTVQDFVGLRTRQRSILADGFHAWSADTNGVRRAGYGTAVDTVQDYVDVLDRYQLQRAMNLAASGQRPPAEWLFIRDARSLLRAGEYRRAVIDAATAAELALTTLLDNHFSATATHTAISEALLDRSQSLGGRCKLVNELMPGTLPRASNTTDPDRARPVEHSSGRGWERAVRGRPTGDRRQARASYPAREAEAVMTRRKLPEGTCRECGHPTIGTCRAAGAAASAAVADRRLVGPLFAECHAERDPDALGSEGAMSARTNGGNRAGVSEGVTRSGCCSDPGLRSTRIVYGTFEPD